MATATLTPYKDDSNQVTFNLVSSHEFGAKYMVSGRAISKPYTVEIVRKFTSPSAAGNDRVIVRISRTEAHATTGKLATCVAKLEISIPKDDSVLTSTVQTEIVSILASLCNEATAMEATTANITALIEGRDL
jgi:hypothetical protein